MIDSNLLSINCNLYLISPSQKFIDKIFLFPKTSIFFISCSKNQKILLFRDLIILDLLYKSQKKTLSFFGMRGRGKSSIKLFWYSSSILEDISKIFSENNSNNILIIFKIIKIIYDYK